MAPLLLTSCGGGGGGGGGSSGGSTTTPTTPAPTPGGNIAAWQSGVYAAATEFKNKCATVRTGMDAEGTPFPDKAGTRLHETNWLRSWTRETYLWNTEVTDFNPSLYTRPVDYFAVLRTMHMTPSGRYKDEYHFSEPTVDFIASRNATPTASYGMALAITSSYVPRDIRVVFTEPNSPASVLDGSGQPNVKRGTRIIAVNGLDLVYGGNTQAEVDAMNNALFPAKANQTNTFRVRDADGTERSLSLTSANISPKPVNRTNIINTGTGKVGYVLFNSFGPYASEHDLVDAIQDMKTGEVTDLVLDLRYNGGGLLAVASQLSYMIAGDTQTTGKNFESLKFNSSAGNLNPITGQTNTPTPFYKTTLGFSLAGGSPLPSLNLSRVFILSTGNTCSASESVINSLRGIDVEVILIGDTTCGKPYGFYPQDNCGQTYYTIQFQGVNHKGFGDYADGFVPQNSYAAHGVKVPGCVADDALTHELGDTSENLLSVALTYRQSGSCPAGFTSSSQMRNARSSSSALGNAYATSPALTPPARSVMQTNRDMAMPDR
ncbi:MAG: S41 family peptidase [Asticcacaulis sp.]